MKLPRPVQSSMLPPVRRSSPTKTSTGQPIGWIQGYAGTPRKNLSAHQLRASLVAIHAPLVLASPLPTVAGLVTNSQLSNNTWVTAGTAEVTGCRYLNFFIKNIDSNENSLLARPFRVIDSERFIDEDEDPYFIAPDLGVRIPVVCDCEVVGLEVMDFVAGSHARYTVGVGMTP